jgi:hypothetical protein
MTTLHEEAAATLLESLMKTKDGIKILAHHHRWLRELKEQGHQDYLDCIGQYHWKGSRDTDSAQLASCYAVHYRLISPYMTSQSAVETRETPHPDARRRENGAILTNLHPPYVAEVYQYQDDPSRGDGILRWTQPIRVLTSTDTSLIIERRTKTCREKDLILDMMRTLPPGQVPLEIGYTKASKTLFHLLHDGGVARWPYGQQEIRLWVTLIRPTLDL